MKWILMIAAAIAMTMIPQWSKEEKKKNIVTAAKVILVISLIILGINAFNSGFSEGRRTSGAGSGASVTCPNCGTGFREGTTGASMIRKYGHCQICNGR